MKRLETRVANLERNHIPLQRVVQVVRRDGQSQEEAITAAGYDPNDDELFIIVRSIVCSTAEAHSEGHLLSHESKPNDRGECE